AAMQATVAAVSQEAKKHHLFKPIVIAVTILTSLQDEDLRALGLTGRVHDNVMRLATLAKEAGLDGIVCSPQEIKMIKDAFGDRFVTVTPGIRPAWASEQADQKRVETPRRAIADGTDFIVVGRPILKAKKPVKAVRQILEEMQ
ncbi:MAG: orotidine-5'-phosphate decarboxylase, partial [Candidatus Omnitrophica bacterium]|nr:orotidine-5'-phosphate decarboxylase [Candidatus Omnitrophota bacterium]